MNNATYAVFVEVDLSQGTAEVMIHQSIPSGISGPFSDAVVVPVAEIDAQIERFGYRRTGDFGPFCANQFCEAPVELLGPTRRLLKFSTLADGVFIEVPADREEYAPSDRCFRFDGAGNAEYAFFGDLRADPARARWYGHAYTEADFTFA